MIVSSVHNQRVEAMNRNIRERVLDPFLDCFSGLRNEGFLNLSSNVHMLLLKLVFKDLLLDVMATFVLWWNNHTMRVNTDNPDSPAGRPSQLFLVPEAYRRPDDNSPGQSYAQTVTEEDYKACLNYIDTYEVEREEKKGERVDETIDVITNELKEILSKFPKRKLSTAVQDRIQYKTSIYKLTLQVYTSALV